MFFFIITRPIKRIFHFLALVTPRAYRTKRFANYIQFSLWLHSPANPFSPFRFQTASSINFTPLIIIFIWFIRMQLVLMCLNLFARMQKY